MSDDFGTVNVRRGDRGREIELLRQQYARHRDGLMKLASDAPSEHLATEYQRLVRDIDSSLAKLDELENTVPNIPNVAPPPAAASEKTLITPQSETFTEPTPAGPRLILIAVAAVVVLALIGFLIYRASGDRNRTAAITESTTSSTTSAIVSGTTAPPPTRGDEGVAAPLAVSPALLDYGTIRKGTRATRQLELVNNSAEPIRIKVARSQCKCLFYEHREVIAPKSKETITVTVDGVRAKAGPLQETIDVSSTKDKSMTTSFQVSANIK